MKEVTFLGPPRFLRLRDGTIVERGEITRVSNNEAARLKKYRRIKVKVSAVPDADHNNDEASASATATDKQQEDS